MRTTKIALAIGTALALCHLASSPAVAKARTYRIIHEPRARIYVPVQVERPYWDSYVVPRYRYRPEDDRIDPYGPPVVPVIRFGNQEMTVPGWWGW